MERAAGIEPACLTWKDSALPLSYARALGDNKTRRSHSGQDFFRPPGKIFEVFLNVRRPLIFKGLPIFFAKLESMQVTGLQTAIIASGQNTVAAPTSWTFSAISRIEFAAKNQLFDYKPVGLSTKCHGRLKRCPKISATFLTPKVSVA
jgi:hypothetical protein